MVEEDFQKGRRMSSYFRQREILHCIIVFLLLFSLMVGCARFKKKTESNAQIYRGIKGIKAINEEILKSREIFTILPDIGEEIMKEFYIGNFSNSRS